jgi:hypothetical protein
VLRQPGGVVWDIFDERIAAIARQFEDFRSAESSGAVIQANSRDELAAQPERWRSELVLRCIDDYLSGECFALTLIRD